MLEALAPNTVAVLQGVVQSLQGGLEGLVAEMYVGVFNRPIGARSSSIRELPHPGEVNGR